MSASPSPPASRDAPAAGFRGQARSEITARGELATVDEYLAWLLSDLRPLEPIELRLGEALGLVLADDVASGESLPSFANSAMDGYAVRAADVAAAARETPTQLRVSGEVAAGGQRATTVAPGTATRIMTGAPLPDGADAVVPVEVTRETNGSVEIFRRASLGEFVRPVGQDVQEGQTVLKAGRRIRPADVALLAALGRDRILCYPAPRVVVLSSGDELVRADQAPARGQIRDANGPMLTSLVRQTGAVPFHAGIVRDDRRAVADAFDSNLGHADLFITSGGVSAGTRDFIRDVLPTIGDVRFTKVAMQPGMPQVYGRIRGVPVFGLPGNPVSSFVSFEVFVRPGIRRLQARRDATRPAVTATIVEAVTSPPNKRSFLRVKLRQRDGAWLAKPTGGQGSHVITSIVSADGLAEIPEDRTSLEAGEQVRVRLLVDS